MNIVLGIISVIITFSFVVLIERFFKKEGLFAWVSISTIMANIIVCKSVDVLGITTTLGNILFASNFLATDIINEKYSFKDSKKAVILGLCSQIIFLITTQISLLYIPNEVDTVQESMKTLFSINIRVSIASMAMYFISNMVDVYLYERIKKKIPDKLWLRNNVSTIVCNCLENYFFNFFAFIGIYDLKTVCIIATSTTIIEIIIAILDTPFLYLARRKKDKTDVNV